jgi:hypothetical protein
MRSFDIGAYVQKAKYLDLVDVIIFTHDEACKAEKYLRWHQEDGYYRKQILNYYEFMQQALRFFEQGGQAQDVETSLQQDLQPVIEILARKGQIREAVLS